MFHYLRTVLPRNSQQPGCTKKQLGGPIKDFTQTTKWPSVWKQIPKQLAGRDAHPKGPGENIVYLNAISCMQVVTESLIIS